MASNTLGCAPTCKVSFGPFPCRAGVQTHQQRWVRAGESSCTTLSVCVESPRLQHVADECWAHVVPYPGARLRSREKREYHTEQPRRRLLGTSLWVEKRTVPELFHTVHDDLFTTNKEEGPLLHCTGTSYHHGKRGNGENEKRTIRLDSAGEVPATAYGERSSTSSPGESHKDYNGAPSKKYCRSEAAKHAHLLGLDLTFGLGLKGASEQIEEPFVGEYYTSGSWQDTRWKACSESRIVPRSQQSTRNLDPRTSHWVGPVGIHHIVEECRVLWKTGRSLQIIPAGLPRDHMPILLNLRYTLQPQRTEETQFGHKWDLQAIADCLQRCDKREKFLQAVDNSFEQAKQKFDAIRENPAPDTHCALWVDRMREPARTFFSLHRTSKRERDDAHTRLSALRRKLVSESATRREQMGKFWKTCGHLGDYSEQHLHARHRLMILNWQLRR